MDDNSGTITGAIPSEAEVTARVEALLGRMSLEDKIGQLTQISGAEFMPGPKPEAVIRKGGAGSVLWLNDRQRFNELQKIAVEESSVKDPAALRTRRDSRLPDNLPRTAGHGLVLGSVGRRTGAGCGGQGSVCCRPALDLWPDARYRP